MSNVRLDILRGQFAINLILLAIALFVVTLPFRGCEVRHPFDRRACQRGSVEACLSVAKAYEDVHSDDFAYLFSMMFGYHHAAKVWYGHACDLGSAVGCYHFGDLSRGSGDDWFGTSFSTADQMAGLTKGCNGHFPDACLDLGVRYAKGEDVPRDDVHAAQLFAAACEGKVGRACNWLGIFLWNGRGGFREDAHHARQMFQDACTLLDAVGCGNLRSAELRKDLDKEDCAAGDALACQRSTATPPR